MQSNSDTANAAPIDVVIHGIPPHMISHVAALARPLLDTDNSLPSEAKVEAYWTVTSSVAVTFSVGRQKQGRLSSQYANKW